MTHVMERSRTVVVFGTRCRISGLAIDDEQGREVAGPTLAGCGSDDAAARIVEEPVESSS